MKYQLINPINKEYTPIVQVLTNRGIEYDEVSHYLNTTDEDIYSSLLLDRIDEAAKMLVKHLADDKLIYVIVDADCDGFTSSAILLNYLHEWMPSIVESKFYYVFHPGKQHGIDVSQIKEGTGLVIAADSSSNEVEIHKELFEQGIDVLILDHHHADSISEYACVVNNQLCDYPTKSLSGAGIVYKFCQYLDTLREENKADLQLDLTMLGITADMMSLRDMETRQIISKGIAQIRNPFLAGMVEKNEYSIGSAVTPIGIAFYVAPYVNAITRVGTLEEKITLFESMLEWKAYEEIPSTKRGCKGLFESRVEQAIRTCINVKNRQTRLRDDSLEAIENKIEEEKLLDKKLLIIKLDNISVDRSIAGLIANQLMSKYQRPTAILSPYESEEGLKWEGSARGYDKSQLKDFRTFCEDSNLVYLAQGHANAFGLGILDSNFEAFMEYAEKELEDIEFEPSYRVDYIFSANDFNSAMILDIASLKPWWGQDIDEAYVAIEGIKVTRDNLYLMSRDKNPTLKINLPNGVSCIKFKSSEEEFNKLFSESGCVVINVVGKCEANVWNDMVTPQIIIENYDIMETQQFYF